MSLETETSHWRAAVVSVLLPGHERWFSVPAVFLFDTRCGFAWVEPSYADPMGAASPALHERDGQPRWMNGFYQIETDAGESITIREFDPEDGNDDDIVDAITWWERWLASEARTPAEERELLRAEIWPDGEGLFAW